MPVIWAQIGAGDYALCLRISLRAVLWRDGSDALDSFVEQRDDTPMERAKSAFVVSQLEK